MNNDLISRERLKNTILLGNYDTQSKILSAIDNAPTVNLEKTSFMKGYNYGCDDGKKFYERPKGTWIECTKSGMPLTEYGRMTGEKWYGFKCSQCNFIYKGNALIDSPFCQKCGADMKGGAE